MRDSAAQILVYSEEPFLSEGLASVVRGIPGEFRVAACYSSLSDAIEFVRNHTVDIALLELNEELSVPALRDLRRSDPKARIVLWTSGISREIAFQAIELGIRGILPKATSIERSLNALRRVKEGDTWFEKETLEGFLSGRRVALTHREGQLVSLLAQGLKNKEIAWTLQITEGTVKVYLSRLFRKLGVNDRFELALCGLKNMQSGYSNSIDRKYASATDRAEASLTALRSILVETREEPVAAEPGRLMVEPLRAPR